MNSESLHNTDNRQQRAKVFDRVISSISDLDGFGGKTPAELFDSDPQHIAELFENINSDQYKEILDGINGILRDKPRDSWGYDGDGVTIAGEGDLFASAFFPDPEAKAELIEKSFEIARKLVSEERDVSDVAYLLSSIVSETHPYADGNGRTGRVVYDLLANGYDPDRLKGLLAEEGRDELNVSIPKRDFNQVFYRQMNTGGLFNMFATESGLGYGSLSFPDGIPSEMQGVMVERARGDTDIFILAIVKLMETHPELDQENYVISKNGRNLLIFEKLVRDLNPELAEELMERYWDFKKKNIEMIIDVFANPEKDEYQIQEDDESIPLLEKWKQHLNR